MKIISSIFAFLAGTLVLCAQSTPPEGTISSHPIPDNSGVTASRNDVIGGGTFTNAVGTTYTVDQLAGQLQQLRSTIDELMPTLSAFTESFSNSLSGGQSTVAGTVSGILSGILNRNTNSNSQTSTGGLHTSKLLDALGRLLGKNTNATNLAAAPVSQGTYENIVGLQTNLQAAASILQNLNIGRTGNSQIASPTPPDRGLTPTGR